jgi:hypothetical protein
MKFNKILGYVLLLTLVSGCASSIPSPEEIANGDYGAQPSQEECETIAERKIRSVLKDPNSAMFNHAICYRGYGPNAIILPLQFGYWQEGTVNAKNSYGGYTGGTGYKVLINNGRAVRYCLVDDRGWCPPNP